MRIVRTAFFVGGLLFPFLLQAQVARRILDLAGRILADTASAERPRFIAYPTIAYTPETSWEFGISSLLVYHAGRDTTNRLSEVSTFAFVTLEGQYGIWLDNALYTKDNTWFFLGRARYQRFPLKYFGIGSGTPASHVAVVDSRMLLLRQRALRRVVSSLYAGVELDVQHLGQVDFRWANGQEAQPLPAGGDGTFNLGLGAGLVFDQRHNVLNVREGFFGEVAWLSYRPGWGSEYRFDAAFVDMRYFLPVRRSEVLAFQGYGTFLKGEVPYHQLAQMGGETIMRGYYTGRYRDRQYVAVQAEYRWLPFAFSRRWGGALFASAGMVDRNLVSSSPKYVRMAGGAGIRFLLFPRKDIFTRLDVAFTQEGTGFYFYIGEAF